MATLKIKDDNGNWLDIPAIRGRTPRYRGQHVPGTVYDFYDWVTHGGSSYLYINPVSSTVGLSDTEYWGIIAEGGYRINPRGEWSPSADPLYSKDDLVSDSGSSYLYINDTPSNELTSDTTHWQQIATQGLKGDPFEYEDFTPEQLAGLVGNGIKSILRTSGDGTPGTTDTYTITFDDDSTTTFPVYNGADGDISNIKVDGANKTKAAGVVDLTSDFARYALWRKTASGNPVSVYPVPESPLYPKVSGTFTQEGTGDPSPSNIRPITPWLASGATARVTRTGKNLLKNAITSKTQNGLTIIVNIDKSLTINGTASAKTYINFISAADNTPLFPGTYVLSGSGTGADLVLKDYAKDITLKSGNGLFTVRELIQPVICYYSIPSGTVFSNVTLYPQLEIGSTATPYEPYSGQ